MNTHTYIYICVTIIISMSFVKKKKQVKGLSTTSWKHAKDVKKPWKECWQVVHKITQPSEDDTQALALVPPRPGSGSHYSEQYILERWKGRVWWREGRERERSGSCTVERGGAGEEMAVRNRHRNRWGACTATCSHVDVLSPCCCWVS